jgi:hypothetical protein
MDTTSETPKVKPRANLDRLAFSIRQAFEWIEQSEDDALHHALGAGNDLNLVRDVVNARKHKHPGGFRGWMEEHGLRKSACYNYMLIARHWESVHARGHKSIGEALRALRAKPSNAGKRSDKSENAEPKSPALSQEAVVAALVKFTPDQQLACLEAIGIGEVLDTIGVDGVLAGMSSEFGRELRSRVPKISHEVRAVPGLTFMPKRGRKAKTKITNVKKKPAHPANPFRVVGGTDAAI